MIYAWRLNSLWIALANTHHLASKSISLCVRATVSTVQVTCDPQEILGTLELKKWNHPKQEGVYIQ